MSQQRPFPMPDKNALDHAKLKLSGMTLPGAQRPPTICLRLAGNNPRFTAYSNHPEAEKGGKIEAPVDAPTFYAIMEAIDELPNLEPNHGTVIPCREGKPWEPIDKSSVIIGRDKEGIAFIGIKDSNNRLKFSFMPNGYHDGWALTDGTPVDHAQLSLMFARGMARMWRDFFSTLAVDKFTPPEPKDKNGGGNRGGGNYNRGGGGGNQNRGGGYNNNSNGNNNGGQGQSGGGYAQDFDDFGDDLPM